MVNNYVKMGAVPKPDKKRYSRTHVARLIIVCTLKPVLPLARISELVEEALARTDIASFYDAFRAQAGDARAQANAAHASADRNATCPPALQAALRAQAEQALAL